MTSKANKILSPNRKKDKSCDIESSFLNNTYYFESKDRSELIYTNSNSLPKIITEEQEAANWIIAKAKESDRKGSNYLICRPDLYNNFGDTKNDILEYFYNEWLTKTVGEHFNILCYFSKNEIVVEPREKIFPDHFKGIYIVKEIGYIKIIIVNKKCGELE